ncbi:MAG: transposase [Gammaproteobacteria bacterium]|nr:transposase [Gammaproteobacteria bacterium]
MPKKYRQFSAEFKAEAVRLAESSDKAVTQIARELDIRVNQIYKWKKELTDKTVHAFPGKKQLKGSEPF